MADKDDIFYGLNKAERDALPSLSSHKGMTVPEIALEMGDRFETLLKVARRSVFKRAYFAVSDSYLRRRHEKRPEFYSNELAAINALAKKPAAYTLNESYDYFCTSASRIVDGKPVIISTLDWGKLPEICHAVYHAECDGEQGPYDIYNVTGYAGIFRGCAEGRFAVALNRAPVPSIFPSIPVASEYEIEHSLKQIGKKMPWGIGTIFNTAAFAINYVRGEFLDKAISTTISYFSRNKAAPFLLREVFDTAANFTEAVDRIAKEPLSAPALMVLTGVDETENCAIYRTRRKCVIETTLEGYERLSRQFQGVRRVKVQGADKICVANHWPDHVGKTLGYAYDRVDFPRIRDANMRMQLDNDHVDIKQGVEVDSTVIYAEYSAATGDMRAVAIDNTRPIAYHVK